MADSEISLAPSVEVHDYHLFSNPRLERFLDELAGGSLASQDTINHIKMVLSSRDDDGVFICDDGIVHFLDKKPEIKPE